MKKRFIIVIVAIAVGGAVFFLLKRPKNDPIINLRSSTNFLNIPVGISQATSIPPVKITSTATNQASSVSSIPTSRFENIADLKNKIATLKLFDSDEFDQVWVSDGPEFEFGIYGKTEKIVIFQARFIEATADSKTGRLKKLVLHGSKFKIEDLQPMIIQLLELIHGDSKSFLEWVGKNGNKWTDASEFVAGEPAVPQGQPRLSFSVDTSYDNEKPWFVNFLISKR